MYLLSDHVTGRILANQWRVLSAVTVYSFYLSCADAKHDVLTNIVDDKSRKWRGNLAIGKEDYRLI